MARFQNKVVLVTGGARGQGAAEARLLVAEGAKVVIGDVLEAEGRRLASELGSAAVFLRHDVTDEADWAKAIDAAETLGGLHGMVNNAGIFIPRPLLETDAALFERHMRINQLGCFLGMKAVAGPMERSGGGSIVNISSVAGLRGSPGAIAYSATKWALRGMTKAAAIDFAPRGIRVNSVHPGPIDTEMLSVRTPEETRRRIQQVPMKRMGTAEEVAKLVLFLLSDESAYITGAEVTIDGGQSMGESTSRFLARAGCDVAVIDIERERAERVAGVVTGFGTRGLPIIGDVLDDAQIPAIVASAEHQLGGLDVMASIVGAAVWGSLLDTTAAIWDQQLHLNLRYFFLCAKEVAAAMIKRGNPGTILGIASVDGQRASPMRGAYGAAKAVQCALRRTVLPADPCV
jgi:3alpha(or 20beta)-hydroxysteroid dehydrogenase